MLIKFRSNLIDSDAVAGVSRVGHMVEERRIVASFAGISKLEAEIEGVVDAFFLIFIGRDFSANGKETALWWVPKDLALSLSLDSVDAAVEAVCGGEREEVFGTEIGLEAAKVFGGGDFPLKFMNAQADGGIIMLLDFGDGHDVVHADEHGSFCIVSGVAPGGPVDADGGVSQTFAFESFW